jgi:hypothetical protein
MHWESMSAKSNRALPDDISTRSTQFHVWTYDKKRCESGAAQLGHRPRTQNVASRLAEGHIQPIDVAYG